MNRFLVSLFFLGLSAQAGLPGSILQNKTDSLFSLDSDEHVTVVDVIENTSTAYYAVTFKNVNIRLENLLGQLNNVAEYGKLFISVGKSLQVSDSSVVSGPQTFFIQVQSGMARSWFLGDINGTEVSEEGEYRLEFKRNRDSVLNARWREEQHGWMTFEYDEFIIVWYLKSLGPERTRIGMTAYLAPAAWIPHWLVKMVSRRVFPGFITDLEKYQL